MVNTRRDIYNQSTKQASESSSQLQTKQDSVKTEEPQLIKKSSKRSSACLDDEPPTLKLEYPPHGTVDDLWRGNAVGSDAKKLFEAIDQCYPTTFQSVQIRVTQFWLNNLKELYVAIRNFMGLSVDLLVEEEITRLYQDFKDFESLGFDLSWVHQRLEMVGRLKFGKEPLHEELIVLEQSVGPLKERVDEIMKEILKAHDMYTKARSKYEDVVKARNKKTEEMVQRFGSDFDRVLKGVLGFGMLPGY